MKCEVCNQNKAVKEAAYQIGSLITLVSVCCECSSDIANSSHILNTGYKIRRMSAYGEEK
ncbi:hypothetical protein BFL38_14210 [Brachyspira hampsonii]|uniref:Uncharacterized protein n=1 Tax=Brachyspira hampsonii TaxID=1287055 RepID=A0A1E5NH00_9SPIR|nr:hypothetical protein [Brachyspira hampsonii]OEJ15438.1 hypothetical protein BFL38_14210 [Brachyspira hampsonii]